MKRLVLTPMAIGLSLTIAACEPRDPADPAVEAVPAAELPGNAPVATSRAASQPPAIPIAEHQDSVVGER